MQHQFHNQNGQHCRWWHHPSSSWSVLRWWFHCILLMWQRSVPWRQLRPWWQLHTLSSKEHANGQPSFQVHWSSQHMSQVAHQASALSGFCSMKRLGVHVFLLPPGWDASTSQPWLPLSIKFAQTHLYTWVERHHESKVSCPRTQHNVPG